VSANGSDPIAPHFANANLDDLPDPHELDDRLRSFWTLCVGQSVGIDVMTPAEVSTVLRDVYSINVPRQRVEGILSRERGTVANRKKKGKRAYQLMGAGSRELDTAAAGVTFIEPTQAYSKLREVHAILGDLTGDLRVCDPYVELRTLDMLAECANADSIKLLTVNVKQASGFKQAMKAFVTEHGITLDVRVLAPGVLHDRFVIHDGGMLMLGTSFNGLGLRQSFVIALGQDIRASVAATFDADWLRATPL
jgi:hypothetical protein